MSLHYLLVVNPQPGGSLRHREISGATGTVRHERASSPRQHD
jgi:hypothetical protein